MLASSFMFVNPKSSSLIQAMTTWTVNVHVILKPFAVFKEHLVQYMLKFILGFGGVDGEVWRF